MVSELTFDFFKEDGEPQPTEVFEKKHYFCSAALLELNFHHLKSLFLFLKHFHQNFGQKERQLTSASVNISKFF